MDVLSATARIPISLHTCTHKNFWQFEEQKQVIFCCFNLHFNKRVNIFFTCLLPSSFGELTFHTSFHFSTRAFLFFRSGFMAWCSYFSAKNIYLPQFSQFICFLAFYFIISRCILSDAFYQILSKSSIRLFLIYRKIIFVCVYVLFNWWAY